MRIKFLGATHQVTGSSYFLDIGGLKILVDCGLFQERDYSYRNWEPFPVSPDQIQYILLTHVHIDHSGLIPKLVKEGFTGTILLTPPSKELFSIVLSDSARMMEEDAAFKKKRHEKEGRKGSHPEMPLYSTQDVQKCLSFLKAVDYEESYPLNDRVKVCFHNAGHILGSAMVEIIFQDEKGTRNIIFSGDIGQWNNPLLSDPCVFDRADFVIMESTYGDRNHDNRQDCVNRLCEVVNETIKAGGNVLIPTFAIERAQELLYYFNRLAQAGRMSYVVTFLDSPMAVEITKVFEQYVKQLGAAKSELFKGDQSPFEFPGLTLVETVEASKAINAIKGSAIIMAGSGMITGGRIKHHLVREITRPESTLVFVGYQAQGTLGRQISDGVSPVRIFGQTYPVTMKVERIEGFSAHAGKDDLERWLSNFKSPPTRIFLTHGEEEAISSLEDYLRSKNGWEVSAPEYLQEYEF